MREKFALRVRALLTAFVLGLFFSGAAVAADDDLPGRVGRVADFGGDIFIAPEERASEWTSVGLNQPITSGDNVWVNGNGRAEVDYGGGQLRVAGGTNLHVSRLDERELALFVAQGRVVVRVRVLDPNDAVSIDTPNTQVQLNRTGLYRIDVDPDRETTTLTVREGEATLALAGGAQRALPGQSLAVSGNDPTYADISSEPGPDGFDTWSANRDRYYERARSTTSYVSRQMVGYADLDNYGTWDTSPTYGAVWYPSTVVADWAPYRFGHWTWIAGFGYAWVDDAPWGYAPFHYGRWVYVGNRWGWCPGQYVARPVWAPALVGWYGGSGWSLSVSYGSPVYGWVPLAWGEPLHPWWGRCSNACWVRYNRPYAVNVTVVERRPPTTYVNVRVAGAITAVAGTTLAAAKPVASNLVPVRTGSPPPVLSTPPSIKPLPVAAPVVRAGSAGAPAPASTLYQAAKPRVTPLPSYGAPARNAPAAATRAAPAAPAASVRAVPAAPAAAVPSAPAAAPRIVEPKPRQVPRQEATNVPQPTPAPAVAAPRAEPRMRQTPRQEAAVPPPAPVPAARAVTPAAPAPVPAARAVTPAAPAPVPVPAAQPAPHPQGHPAARQEGDKPNAHPHGAPQETPK